MVVISLAYFAFPNARLDFTPYNSHDSESYISLSKNLLEGRGYTRSLNQEEYVPHTLWPPGMAILLMPSVAASGDTISLLLVKLTIIATSLAGVWLARFYLIQLAFSRSQANAIALMVLLNPFVWHFSRIAMAEMPVFTWQILSLLLIHLCFKAQRSILTVSACGFLVGLGMLIKGALLGIPLAILPYLYSRGLFKKESIARGVVFGAAFSVPFFVWTMRNRAIDTSGLGLDGVNQVQMITKKVIEDPDSEFKTTGEIIATAKQNILWHAIYHVPRHTLPVAWLMDLSRIPAGNLIALAGTFAVSLLILAQFQRFSSVILSVLPAMAIVAVMTIGGAERYWFSLVGSLLMIVYASPVLFRRQSTQRCIFATLAIVQFISLGLFVVRHETHPFSPVEGRDDLAALFMEIGESPLESSDPQATNVCTINNHGLQLTTGLRASMVNTNIDLDPRFTHAVLDREALSSGVRNPLMERGRYMIVELPTSMTRSEIRQRYYRNSEAVSR
ncbi:hypothetical protein LOC67_12955 [Stieleria sp. JC731]|uniref:ArnT family glycosyltransferase n=2 Tax=Pirellulaceae TaxID=2691357 RepID=UPI001E2DE9D1|nr:hypothetical protein [Stieleria sp. JC731]MCC9601458.1 hypothetical protein [Stieleria sp. JC731]